MCIYNSSSSSSKKKNLLATVRGKELFDVTPQAQRRQMERPLEPKQLLEANGPGHNLQPPLGAALSALAARIHLTKKRGYFHSAASPFST